MSVGSNEVMILNIVHGQGIQGLHSPRNKSLKTSLFLDLL